VPVPVHSSWSRFHRPPSTTLPGLLGSLWLRRLASRLFLLVILRLRLTGPGRRLNPECVSGRLFLTARLSLRPFITLQGPPITGEQVVEIRCSDASPLARPLASAGGSPRFCAKLIRLSHRAPDPQPVSSTTPAEANSQPSTPE